LFIIYQNKECLVEIYGGFGNQLFQLNFAQILKNKGFEVFVNTRDFERVAKENSEHLTARKLVLPVENFNLNEIRNQEYINYKFRRITRNYKILNKATLNNKTFSVVNDNNLDLENLLKKNHFIGYWQDLNYLKENKESLISSLKNNKTLKGSLEEKSNDMTMIHVRRNDYLKFNEELPIIYYEKAIDYLKEKTNKLNFNVFTDDLPWSKNQKIFKNAQNIFTSSDSPKETIETFSLMLRNKNFIIANSTFSLLAAFLAEKSNSIITYPDPWFRSRSYNKNITSSKWQKIKYN
tara:strand:+ start:1718 stop:2596 length:879 start_codon:yes stop_codon:yes gene_type:complete